MVNPPNSKLTPSRRRLLFLLDRDGPQGRMGLGPIASICIEGGWAERCEVEVKGFKVPGIRITDAGRAALSTN